VFALNSHRHWCYRSARVTLLVVLHDKFLSRILVLLLVIGAAVFVLLVLFIACLFWLHFVTHPVSKSLFHDFN
jgi:hypothetical protein